MTQQQTEELVKVETDLAMKKKIGEQLDLTAKKLMQNREAEIANDTKMEVANQMYSGGESGYGNDLDAVYQANGKLDAKIENEQELSSHIDNVQECDRLKMDNISCFFFFFF